MTWTMPQTERRTEPRTAPEREMLQGWLDYHRDTLLMKCAGLTPEQLRTPSVPTSTLTLHGLLRHLALVERWWFRQCFLGEDVDDLYWTPDNPDGDFDDVPTADARADLAVYQAETAACDAAVADRGLDEIFTDKRGRTTSLRWVYGHLIEEYARHNGHADLLREAIDGVTGE
ncbi:DinB family protein [Streptomyces sp. NPDC051940]|uniref:DinB family protein n=1 Tax=Streptomyces sp. NPDC051940 TaxID=3155675 RepID=UPI00341CA940